MMEALTPFDGIAIVIIIVSTLMALARGFMRELATLGAFIAALAAAMFANNTLSAPLAEALPDSMPETAPMMILFIGTFLIIYIIVAWFGASLSKSIQGVDGISLIDRIAGGVFGFARGAVVLIFFVYLLNLAMDRDQIPEFVSQSRTYPAIAVGADVLGRYAPELEQRGEQQLSLDADTRAE